MKEQIINQLNQMLANNMGNRLTPEIATGILTQLHQLLLQQEESVKVDVVNDTPS